jgi:proteasome lid subunit RPN8/RPN11
MKKASKQNHYLNRLWRDLCHEGTAIREWNSSGGRPVWLIISVYEVNYLVFKTYHLRARVREDSACCEDCRRYIARLGYSFSEENLELLIIDFKEILTRCPTTCKPTPLPNTPTPAEVPQSRVRLSPESDENRIKLLVPEHSTNTPEPPPSQSSDPADAIKIKKRNNVKVLTPGQTEQNVSSQQADTELHIARHVYGAPSIRYSISSGTQVEVTIPRYLCDQIIQHCAESNSTHREVGGILIGYTFETDRSPRKGTLIQNSVTDLLGVKPADSSISHLTIDAETWLKVGETIDKKYTPQGKVRLGWYHTHPNQGIFFSGQDKDTHTNFTLPHQFALVIDPRTMSAGLFAWDHYDERLLVKSHHFPLKLRSETAEQYSDRSNHRDPGDPDDSNSDFSIWRIFLFGIALVALIFYIAVIVEPPGIGPNQAIMLAFAGFLGLRLWNAHFFNPRTVFEAEAGRKIGRGVSGGFGRLGTGLTSHPRVADALFFSVCGIALTIAGYLCFRLLTSQPSPVVPTISSLSAQTANINAVSPSTAPDPIVLSVTEKIDDSKKKTLRIAANGLNASIVYTQERPGTSWTPENGESDFFLKVFNLKLSESGSNVKNLQRILRDATNAGESFTQDGEWGNATRNLFIQWLNSNKDAPPAPIRGPVNGTVVTVQWSSE